MDQYIKKSKLVFNGQHLLQRNMYILSLRSYSINIDVNIDITIFG